MSITTEDIRCPACKGRKQSYVHLNYGGAKPGEWRFVDCRLCDGAGTITPEHAERVARGKRIAADRKARLRTLDQEAKALGCLVVELSKVEMGRASEGLLSRIERLRAGRAAT